jgi:hypothetical protein
MRRAIALCLLLAACRRGPSPVDDAPALHAALALDQQTSAVLHRADTLTLAGKSAEAATLIEQEGRPKAQAGEAAAGQVATTTAWGQARAKELKKLTHDRAESLTLYSRALAQKDMEMLITALDEQKGLEQRAVALEAALGAPPDK